MNGSSCSRNGCSGRERFFCPKIRRQKPCETSSGYLCDFLQDQVEETIPGAVSCYILHENLMNDRS